MAQADRIDIDTQAAPFDQFRGLRRLSADRSGRSSVEHARHHLYVGRRKGTATDELVKVTSRPGIVYQQNLSNEIATLTTINRELPSSSYFPVITGQGALPDSRVYLITYLFEELPLATSIGPERLPHRLVGHLTTALEIARALIELHRLEIFHVDLNPMNILHRVEKGRPVIRIVDFESSYEVARHGSGAFYSPPMTPGFSAPEVSQQAPDARADLFSFGAVVYTMLAGFDWTWSGEIGACVKADRELDAELRDILMSAVAERPEKRLPSVQKFSDALSGYLESIWPGRSR